MLRAYDYWYEILARNAAFVRFLIHFTTARYFWSNWAYQWNSPAVQESRGMALIVSMVWRVSVFSWLYFYKAQRKKTRGEISNVFVDMSSILDPYEECSAPRTVLIEGEPGMRKTTYCKKYAYDWATKKQAPQGCGSTAFKAVFLLKCREMHSDVWEAIDEQLLPRVWRIQTTISFYWYWMDRMSHHPVNCRFFWINWRKSTPQMPHSCKSKTRNWKRGEMRCFRSKDSLKFRI